MEPDPLALSPERMREMGYAVVDMLVARIEALRDGPVLKTETLERMRERLAAPPPSASQDFAGLLARLDEDVLQYVGHFDHPRFFGYIPGAGTWPAALGDLIAAATNIDAGSWREAVGPNTLELTVLEWFRDWIGYPGSAAGVLVSGGSAANLTAIACAREALIGPMSPRIVMYTGDQTHSSVARAARHLGFRPDQLRVLPTDDDFRLRPADVGAAIDADIAADRLPFLVSANAGTTNTGAVDPIGDLADVCHDRGVWLHVDGAYGAFAVLTERGRSAMPDLDRADSVTLDPHKWLAMPFEVGCLMVREGALLERAFELHPEYLKEGVDHGGVNFADRGLQLTRASRAIKVWLAIETFGLDAFRAAIDRAMNQTLAAEARIQADPRLELVTPASLGILTFRQRGAVDEPGVMTDRRNGAIVRSLAAGGEVLVTATNIKGRYAIRLCVLNHTTTEDDVAFAIDRVAEAEVSELAFAPGSSAADRSAADRSVAGTTVRPSDATPVAFDVDDLRRVQGFESITDDQAARFLAASREEWHGAGEAVTERWAHARTFYVVLDGELIVTVDGTEVNRLTTRDAFGEIAAIDWGRDFSYGRTATVTATTPTRLLAIPGAALRELMLDAPSIDAAIRQTAYDRMHRVADPT
ncbi:MAG: aminotransferase class V-fold PLP-dependent enzyme [Chloroflexota bacterium]